LKSITVIDTFGFLFRAYYALPPLKNSKGFPTGLLTGFHQTSSDQGSELSINRDYILFALDNQSQELSERSYTLKSSRLIRREAPEDSIETDTYSHRVDREDGICHLSKDGYRG